MLPVWTRRLWIAGAAVSTLAGSVLGAARSLRAAEAPAGPLSIGAKPADFAALPNVRRLSEKLYSGGVPAGSEGFQALRRLGIRTVVSVDGMKPEVELARRHGMR